MYKRLFLIPIYLLFVFLFGSSLQVHSLALQKTPSTVKQTQDQLKPNQEASQLNSDKESDHHVLAAIPNNTNPVSNPNPAPKPLSVPPVQPPTPKPTPKPIPQPVPAPQVGWVEGVVTQSPVCPVDYEKPQMMVCPDYIRLVATTITVTDETGKLVITTTSDETGQYKIALQPGTYNVSAGNYMLDNANSSVMRYPLGQTQQVVIKAGETSIVNFNLDSGIRVPQTY